MVDRDAEAAFSAVCEAEFGRLVGTLTLYTGDRALAQDLAQEALARLWRDWGRLQDQSAAAGFAYRAGLNLAKNHFRRRAVVRRDAHLVGAWGEHVDADAADAVAVRQAVAGLPRRQRAALVLRYYADRSVEETAQILDVPANTIKTWTRRSLQALRVELDSEIVEGESHAR